MNTETEPKPKCATCRGRGYRESPPFMEWADYDTPVLSSIKIRCKACGGAGTAKPEIGTT